MLDFLKLQEQFQEQHKDEAAPLMLVDLAAFDQNLEKVFALCQSSQKKFRPATKSIRVPWLLERILQHPLASQYCNGLMLFSIYEATFWWQKLKESHPQISLLVAYPLSSRAEIIEAAKLIHAGCNLVLMVDSQEQIEWLGQTAPEAAFSLCLDLDMSWRPFSGLLHLGVRRSSLQSPQQLSLLLSTLKNFPQMQLKGLMGYEAQIAGMTDSGPFTPLQNPIKKWIRNHSAKVVAKNRCEFARLTNDFLSAQGKKLEFFNGGGTGSLTFARHESWLTEITMGSGLLQSHLFDYYSNDTNQAALFFALPVSRRPSPEYLTLKSGGFISSGEISPDKAPQIVTPHLTSLPLEGFGEVQTPVNTTAGERFKLGDWVMCRPSKAGEIAERFNHYFIVDKIGGVSKVPTYRGLSLNFF